MKNSQRKRLQLGTLDLAAKIGRERLAEGNILPVYHPVLTSNIYCTGTEAWDLSKFEERVEYWYRLTSKLPRDHSIVMWMHNETMRIRCHRNSDGGNAPTRMKPLLARIVHVKAKFVTSLLDSAYENGLSINTGRRLIAEVYA